MISLAVQILTLLCGMLVNFLVPALFGLKEYGFFLQANVLVFLFQKLTDITNEPLISHVDDDLIFPISFLICSFVLVLFCIANELYPIGNPFLLASMLLSSCVLLSMYALRQMIRILLYLIAFLLIFSLTLVSRLTGIYSFTIVDILIITNGIPAGIAAVALLYSCKRLPRGMQIVSIVKSLARSIPSMMSLTLVYNLFTNIFPFLLSKTLPAGDLGLFRVTASIVQSATSFFPINVKAIFVIFVQSKDNARQYKTILSLALLYFSAAGMFGYVIAGKLPHFRPYIALICSLPVLYWAVLSERFLLANHRSREVRLANLFVGFIALFAMFFVTNVQQAILCYAAGFSIYALILLRFVHDRPPPLALLWVCGLSPIVAFLVDRTLLPGGIYLIGCVVISLCVVRMRLTDIRSLKEAL